MEQHLLYPLFIPFFNVWKFAPLCSEMSGRKQTYFYPLQILKIEIFVIRG